MNQRPAKTHRAALFDGGDRYQLGDIIRMITSCQKDLENIGDEDAAVRFEILADYLQNEVAMQGKSLAYTPKMIGI